MFKQSQLRERASYSYCARSWHPQTNPSRKKFLRDFLLWDFTTKNWLRLRRQFKLNMESCEPADEEEMFSWNKLINQNCLQHLNHRVENVIKQLVHTSAMRPSRYETLDYASSNSYVSFVLLKLPACLIARLTHADVWTNC